VVIDAYLDHDADRIVVERNNGGVKAKTLIEMAAERRGVRVRVILVTATRGKQVRAEPVAMLYDQHRVHHVGVLEQLEAEMTEWVPGLPSPNRMDALVWGFTDLLVEQPRARMVHREGPREISVAPIENRAEQYRRRGSGRMVYVP
jgi:phage terminase large subunit-like protein